MFYERIGIIRDMRSVEQSQGAFTELSLQNMQPKRKIE